jgi:hypothetical protein
MKETEVAKETTPIGVTPLPKSKPTYATKPAPLVTKPSPTLITRNVRRYVAMCAVANQTDCQFANRSTPKLHGSSAAAEVEGGRHMRSDHANFLAFEVKAKRSRQVVNESIELVAE